MVQDAVGSGPGTPIRRPRPSMGPMGDQEGRNTIPLELRKTFDDFKRKHVRQNKEIIMDNARCKLAMRTLNEELLALRSELMAVRKTNGDLTRELRRAKLGAPVGDESTRQALDYVLAAMPALQILRDNMSPAVGATRQAGNAPPSTSKSAPTAVALAPRPVAKFVAPAVRGGVSTLRGIVEGSENIEDRPPPMEQAVEGSDVEEEGVICVGASSAAPGGSLPRLAAGLGSGLSPLPRNSTNPVDRMDPASPSPKREKRSSPRKAKVSRKRRESGLIRAGEASQSTPPRSSSPIVVAAASPASSPLGAIVVTSSLSPTPARRSPRKSPKKQASAEAVSVASKPSSVIEPSDNGNAFAAQPVFPEDTDEEGGRGRRSRKSVNYKEPSLTRKMRKPDGMSVEEVIRLGGRQSLSAPYPLHDSLSPSPTPAKALVAATGSASEVASDEPGPSQPLPRIMSMRQPGSTASGVRRKSVLPKAHSAQSAAGPSSAYGDDAYDSEDDDLPAVDMLIPMIITERPAPITSSTKTAGVAVKPAAKPAVAKRPTPSTQRPAPPPPASTQRNVLKDISSANARPGVAPGAARTLPKTSVMKELGKSLEGSQPRGRVVSI